MHGLKRACRPNVHKSSQGDGESGRESARASREGGREGGREEGMCCEAARAVRQTRKGRHALPIICTTPTQGACVATASNLWYMPVAAAPERAVL
eukprot:2323589-Pleurochrysis_carterae.AAC.1